MRHTAQISVPISYAVLPNARPIEYLNRLSGGRPVTEGSSASEGLALSLRVGIRVSPRWVVEGHLDYLATHVTMPVAATRIGRGLDFLVVGGSALHYLGGAYLIGGAGAISLRPEGFESETTAAWTVGLGHEAGSAQFELRDYMSFFDLDPAPGATWHNLILLSVGWQLRL